MDKLDYNRASPLRLYLKERTQEKIDAYNIKVDASKAKTRRRTELITEARALAESFGMSFSEAMSQLEASS